MIPYKRNHKCIASELTEEFISIAKTAKQDLTKLQMGETEVTYFRIESMAEAKTMLSQASNEDRRLRGLDFLAGLEYRSRIPQGMHDRGEAYVFANHPLTEKDLAGHNNHLPIHVRTLSVAEKTLKPGETWDITLKPEEWGTDEREEMYNIININRLVMNHRSKIIVHGNALIFNCQELVKNGDNVDSYDFGILGTKHGFGNRRGEFNGKGGIDGKPGKNGKDGINPILGSCFLGAVTEKNFDQDSIHGTAGTAGKPGKPGQMGLNGGACRITEINIRGVNSIHPFSIAVHPGQGGNGGDGGHGGNGGNGGNGVAASKTIDGIIGPGLPGQGGNGGAGGTGGRAGHGGISSSVYLNVPPSATELFSIKAQAGCAGKPGNKGSGGLAGVTGKGYANTTDKKVQLKSGNNGKTGRDGRQGRKMPAAKTYINNRLCS